MACRIGIAINVEKRIAHWMQVEEHTSSEILARGLTYEEACHREALEATERGCRQEIPRPRVSGAVWSVYHVWGGY